MVDRSIALVLMLLLVDGEEAITVAFLLKAMSELSLLSLLLLGVVVWSEFLDASKNCFCKLFSSSIMFMLSAKLLVSRSFLADTLLKLLFTLYK